MTVFANKNAFQGLGVEDVKPSATHASQDCTICTKPLAVHHIDSSPKSRLRGYHDTVRIVACGHMHGKECLNVWLDVGNACPTCNRILFEIAGDPITQGDINSVVYMLGHEYGEERVTVALVNMMQKQERDHAALRRVHEQEVAQQKTKDSGGFYEGFLLLDNDFLDSDVEMDFGEEEDGDEDYEDKEDEEEDGDEDYEDKEDEERHDSVN
ncbi:hypothetical protein CC86DRAFT_378957 [Ophiobolus disseminans]|uniref:RING-type domain-containing protein n=1 Tax=Ophiobolus disseminans TaxID=1469910 RepID=A0A6A7ABL6_9PLEO|nr:hypothetical protein CC86DRAFT_378957 [Ophiobolus disseminans]